MTLLKAGNCELPKCIAAAMSHTIREMTIEDYPEVISLWKDTEGVGLSESDSRTAIASYLRRNPSLSFVAHADGKLAGAVLCGHDGRRGYLHHLAVAKQARGRGIGRGLVEVCIAALAELGIHKCNIFLFSDNHEGKSFWENNGWLLIGDLIVMQRVIKK